MPIKDPEKNREYHRKWYAERKRKRARAEALAKRRKLTSLDALPLPSDDGIFPYYWELPGYQ